MPVTKEQSQHKEAVSITHNANKWPITMRVNPLVNETRKVAATTICRISDNDLKAKGVTNRWRNLSINDKDVFDNPFAEIRRHAEQARGQPNHMITLTLIPPARIRDEIAHRRNRT